MPAIMPISDLRNYTDVLKEVDSSSRVYLTVKRRIESGGYCKLISAISPLERRSLFANSMILTV